MAYIDDWNELNITLQAQLGIIEQNFKELRPIYENGINTGSGTGWFRLFSGILVKYGSFENVTVNSTEVLSFPTGASIPVFSSIFSVQLTLGPVSDSLFNQSVTLTAYSTTTISVRIQRLVGILGGATQTVQYVAIGT